MVTVRIEPSYETTAKGNLLYKVYVGGKRYKERKKLTIKWEK